jgi:arsenite methyltransferase
MTQVATSTRANYGIDAPPIIRNLALSGVAAILAGMGLRALLHNVLPGLATGLEIWGVFAGTLNLITAALMLWSSLSGKLIMRRQLIDSLHLRGDEQVLDVGCGHGLLLIEAAKRLTTGTATGIDLWNDEDQANNTAEATLANARAEGVADRVKLETGDMRKMRFPDSTFDVIVSSLAIHNIPDETGRANAIREINRVAKPGAQAALLDFMKTGEYERMLRELGWQDVSRSGMSFLMFPPVRIVRGRKPQ